MKRFTAACISLLLIALTILPGLSLAAENDATDGDNTLRLPRALSYLNDCAYADTADGKIRVYAYNRQASPTISPDYADYICNIWNENAIRASVFKALDITGIPQENNGRTIIYFNTALSSGGITISNGDGSYHIEISLTAGPYVLAHEYTHIIQQNKFRMEYDSGHGWWMEGTADWIGKTLYGHDNYLNKLKTIQRSPWEAYDSGSLSNTHSRIYGTAALAMFLQSRNKNLIGKSYVRAAQYSNMRDAINAALNNKLNTEFAEYAIRMYKPSKQITSYIPYAVSWPNATVLDSGLIDDNESKTISNGSAKLGHLGVEYVLIHTCSADARDITISAKRETGVQYWVLTCGSTDTSWSYKRMSSDSTRISRYNTKVKELVVAVINTSGSAKSDISITAKVAA